MPVSLYGHDILAWSAREAERLRRVARGERVSDVDWAHVVAEIEDVGAAQLNAVRSYLRQMLVSLLKRHAWPDGASAVGWRAEVMAFQADAEQRFAPSMRQHIDVGALYAKATRQLRGAVIDDAPPLPWPDSCPLSLDELLTADAPALQARLAEPPP
jgi:hypothetical protein